MRLRNRWGTAVDPVPFLVVAATAFAVCYSFGPIYLITFDVAVPLALAGSTAVYVVVVAVAYHRFVRTYRPEFREEVPVGERFRRLLLGMLVGVGILALLALPLLTA